MTEESGAIKVIIMGASRYAALAKNRLMYNYMSRLWMACSESFPLQTYEKAVAEIENDQGK